MPKADRILAALPPTFRLRGDPSALRALVDAYGGELQSAENSLVAVMRAHWVPFADTGGREVHDLALIAALYGLAPRPDESVEEFRDHLLRYVRSRLDSTVTVQGILRTAAEALGLHLEDEALDTWWTRPDPVLVTSLPDGRDAAVRVLGVPAVDRRGADAQAAELVGDVDLSAGVDLRGPHLLSVALDGGGEVPVDLTVAAADPTHAHVTAAEVAQAVVAELGAGVRAWVADGRLHLASATVGTTSAVHVADRPDDAATLVLGLPPRTYDGAAATRARVVGTADLSTALDLTDARYLRVLVDGTHLVEVDCAAGSVDPAHVDLSDVTAAINAALAAVHPGLVVAADDGRTLTLTSPTVGPAGSVVLLDPAAQPATARLLGDAPRSAVGLPDRRGTLVSHRAIGTGVDLSTASVLRVAVDDEDPVDVDVAGLDPAATLPGEIVSSLNEGLGAQVATHDGDRITLASPVAGAAGSVRVEEVDGDAAPRVLGLRPRSATGAAPVTAAFTGTVGLTAGAKLSAAHVLRLRVDDEDPVDVDLRAGAAHPDRVTRDELVDAVNTALHRPDDSPVASDDGTHLVLVSPTDGAGGRLVVEPLRVTARRRFVTRARVTDDAATTVLGFTAGAAVGTPETSARLAGSTNLTGGVDLRDARWLRVRVGDRAPVEVDCADPDRPRATTVATVAASINAAIDTSTGVAPGGAAGPPVALTDGRTLVLVDPTPGAGSRVEVEPTRAVDALTAVLGAGAGAADSGGVDVRGAGAGGVRFTGTVDLSAGVTVPADAALRLGVDAAAPVDVPLGDGAGPSTLALSRLVALVNLTLGASVAAHDGTHLLLTSPTTGAGSALHVEVPTTGTDVTAALLGIDAPRTYAGRAAVPAQVTGTADLTAGIDLRVAHLLSVTVDQGEAVTVDLTAGLPDGARAAVTAAQVAAAINARTTATASTAVVPGGLSVRVMSPTSGPSSRLRLGFTHTGDAAALLLGPGARVATGQAAGPAVLDGTVDLLGPVDLSGRALLRLAVDGGEPVDVDLAGVVPSRTSGPEVVAAITAAQVGAGVLGGQTTPTGSGSTASSPGLSAALTAEQRLRLTSSTTGPSSRVEVVPVRHLDLEEYPPVPATLTAPVRHGATIRLTSTGASDVPARVEVRTPAGVSGPRLAAPDAGWSVRVDDGIGAGGSLALEVVPGAPGVVRATIVEDGVARVVPPALVQVSADPSGAAPLTVRRGRQTWSWTECRAARFDEASFDEDRFAGGPCTEEAVLDLSRFAAAGAPGAVGDAGTTATVGAVLAGTGERRTTAHVTLTWDSHQAGAFVVHLPADLDPRFGATFGEARFGTADPHVLEGVVTEPELDDAHLVTRVNKDPAHVLVAALVGRVPIGWSPVAVPFRTSVPLTGGTRDDPARLYVSDPGFGGRFAVLSAPEPGTWGDGLRVALRRSTPGFYDLEVHVPGTPFELARATVLGPAPPSLASALLAPSPAGVATAKAAGVRAAVGRDRVEPVEITDDGAAP
ncbi:hypothetical protein [Cellulomonas soli]|uniref:Uncharacterized protein n=1 Tax=Cellulomonas soli TaxID=931535 RepID=A0A512PHQ5_9CELL|nr:hypothetical protein [Cellulomonas soli]NYI59208.1 hypothetical protein [Cellulomonas soli]GEP70713.1 hypothetical protein CSO01_34280 [Cellulomonas soli]